MGVAQNADAPHPLALLRPRDERPRRRAAEKGDERAALHVGHGEAARCKLLVMNGNFADRL